MQQLGNGKRGLARKIDQHVAVVREDFVQQLHHRILVKPHPIGQRFVGGQQPETLGHRHDTAIEKQFVDALRIPQCFAQCVARLYVELQRGVAGVQIEIEQQCPTLPGFGEIPGQAGRDRGCADAAASPDDEHQHAAARWLQISAPADDLVKDATDQTANERLEEILGDAGRLERPIQHDVVAVADDDDLGIQIADFGEPADARQRIVDSADIHDEEPRPAAARQFLDRGIDAAMHDVAVDKADIGKARTHHTFGVGVEQIGHRGRCRRACRRNGVDRGVGSCGGKLRRRH